MRSRSCREGGVVLTEAGGLDTIHRVLQNAWLEYWLKAQTHAATNISTTPMQPQGATATADALNLR